MFGINFNAELKSVLKAALPLLQKWLASEGNAITTLATEQEKVDLQNALLKLQNSKD